MDGVAGLGFDYIYPALGCTGDYMVAQCGEDGDAGGLFGVLRGLFGGCGGIDAVLRAEGDGGEDVFDGFGVGDVD